MNLSYLTGDVRKFLNTIEKSKKSKNSDAELLSQLAKAVEFWQKNGKVDAQEIKEALKLRNHQIAFKHLENLQGTIERAEIEYLYNQLKEN